MGAVRQAERIETVVMEPLYDGGYQARTARKCAFTCLDCGLVWAIRWHAETCDQRGHVARWFQQYPKGPIVNGVPARIDEYPRVALRREAVTPEAIADEADRLLGLYAAQQRREISRRREFARGR